MTYAQTPTCTREHIHSHRSPVSFQNPRSEHVIAPTDKDLLVAFQRAPGSHYFAISLSAPFIVEIKCVTAASLETNVDVEGNGEISAQLAFWLTGLGELKA